MIVIGVDPGTRHLGWGVISVVGSRVSHLAHGVIDANEKAPLAERLVVIDDGFQEILDEYRASEGAVESLFFAKDAQAAAKLGHARGVVLVSLQRAGVEIHEYAPASVKRAIAANGRADKAQVAMMVRATLGLKETPRLDASDALAIAITHVRSLPARRIASAAAALAVARK